MARKRLQPGSAKRKRGDRAALAPNLRAVAEHFGVALQTVKEWRTNGMPGRRGRWDLAAIAAWRDQRRAKPLKAGELDEAMARAKLEREEIKKATDALKLDQLRGGLIERAEHERQRRELVAWFAAVFDRAELELAERMAGKEHNVRGARAVIRRYFNEVRAEIVK